MVHAPPLHQSFSNTVAVSIKSQAPPGQVGLAHCRNWQLQREGRRGRRRGWSSRWTDKRAAAAENQTTLPSLSPAAPSKSRYSLAAIANWLHASVEDAAATPAAHLLFAVDVQAAAEKGSGEMAWHRQEKESEVAASPDSWEEDWPSARAQEPASYCAMHQSADSDNEEEWLIWRPLRCIDSLTFHWGMALCSCASCEG